MPKTTKTTKTTPANRTIETPNLYRSAEIVSVNREDSESGEIKRTFELSFASEAAEVERYFGFEILGHDPGEVRMDFLAGGSAPLLMDHDRLDQVGVIESASIGDGRGRAVVRFGKSVRASEIATDVEDGIRSNVSVGYRVHEMTLTEQRDGDSVYRVTDWEPFEISVVSVPADSSVGVARDGEAKTITKIKQKESGTMPDNIEKTEEVRSAPAAPVAAKPVDLDAIRREARADETKRVTEVMALGEAHRMTDAATKFVNDGKSVSEFREFVLDNLDKPEGSVFTAAADPSIGLTDKEARSFSFLKAMRAQAYPSDRGAQEAAAFEREASAAAAKIMGRDPQGIFVPVDVVRVAPEGARDLTVGAPTGGGNLVATELQPGSFIELLRNKMALAGLGATVLSGLNGDIAIPRQTGGATGYWIAENAAPSESQQTVGQVTLTPKTVAAYTDYSRKLMMQSSIDVENFVRADLATVLALTLDYAGLYGSGSSGQPTGVLNTAGIGNPTDFAGAIPTYAEVVAMETEVATANADIGSTAYICEAGLRGGLKTTEKASGTAQFVWEQGNTLNGYPAVVSNQVVSGDLFFGVWSQLIMGMWGGLDLTADPYTNSTTGAVRIVAMQSCDIAVRHAAAFAHNNDG